VHQAADLAAQRRRHDVARTHDIGFVLAATALRPEAHVRRQVKDGVTARRHRRFDAVAITHIARSFIDIETV
jgi:hypothetical protein